MKEKKYIDRLYQEKFRDFEATPRERVWKSIEAKLQEKQKERTAIPFWYRYAGVAALFVFLFMLGDWLLPVAPTTAVANENTEESTIAPVRSSLNLPVVYKSSEEDPNTKETGNSITRKERTAAIAFNTYKEEQNRTPKEAVPEMASKNAIFGTSMPVASLDLKKEKTPSDSEHLKPSIFDAVNNPEETEIASEEKKMKFEISTHATPIYYGKMGDENPLDVGYNDQRMAELTYSYGVSLALNISDKVKIRSGVSHVDLSYSARGMGYQSSSGAYAVRNASLIKINDSDIKMVTGNAEGRTSGSTNRTPAGVFTQGELNQKMGDVEIPVELVINLVGNKFELNLIGGGSTLFLEENKVTLNTGDISSVGKADNLNNVSFSANLGLGMDYKLSETFKLNLEPMFKYQIKTFDTPSVENVQPYFFGVYTGFSYEF